MKEGKWKYEKKIKSKNKNYIKCMNQLKQFRNTNVESYKNGNKDKEFFMNQKKI